MSDPLCPKCDRPKSKRTDKTGWRCHPCHRLVHADARRADSGARYQSLRSAVVAHLGGACAACGLTDERVLQVHHAHGGGEADRRSRSTATIYRSILQGEQGFQVLCANDHILADLQLTALRSPA